MRGISGVMLLAAAVSLAGCAKEEKKGEDAAATLARDTALAADLREVADTAAFSEAADVAMRDIPAEAPTRPAPPPAPAQEPPGRLSPTRPRPTPIPVHPPAVRPADEPAPRTSASTAAAGDYPTPACTSPASEDQRRCLLAYLARSDVTLDRNYQARIRQLRSEAGTPEGAPEPESVQRLRTAQRAWLVYRDTECRNRNRGREGTLWAPTRAQCLGEFSRARAAELAP
jgi:uncharacterized protein YecT (DUF1311 family)